MTVDNAYSFSSIDVPHDNEMIEARAEQYIFGYGVPLDVGNSPLVALQLDEPVRQVSRETTVRYVP